MYIEIADTSGVDDLFYAHGSEVCYYQSSSIPAG